MCTPGFFFVTSLWQEVFLLVLLFSIQKLTLSTDSLDTVILANVCFLSETGHIWQACAWAAVDCRMQLLTYLCLSNNQYTFNSILTDCYRCEMFCKTMRFPFYIMGVMSATYCLNIPTSVMQSKYIPHLKLVSELVVLYCLTPQTSRCCPYY